MRDSCGTGWQVRHLKVKRYECGSPPAPRKASNLKRKSTTFKGDIDFKNKKTTSFYFQG
ncbi:hypothetical protein QUF49_00645 [Fictibacillus sp. b24]|uniref:hypothetical protein n=1 Tax=Fictibacillus sp. b24 TaxID=3055863 RepID=UPI0025A2DE09|nr:hypothetical protein [Fictibacillus sp. b24]MDM5314479.1 hypothetical protein [Fictibacillus sp. b24]